MGRGWALAATVAHMIGGAEGAWPTSCSCQSPTPLSPFAGVQWEWCVEPTADIAAGMGNIYFRVTMASDPSMNRWAGLGIGASTMAGVADVLLVDAQGGVNDRVTAGGQLNNDAGSSDATQDNFQTGTNTWTIELMRPLAATTSGEDTAIGYGSIDCIHAHGLMTDQGGGTYAAGVVSPHNMGTTTDRVAQAVTFCTPPPPTVSPTQPPVPPGSPTEQPSAGPQPASANNPPPPPPIIAQNPPPPPPANPPPPPPFQAIAAPPPPPTGGNINPNIMNWPPPPPPFVNPNNNNGPGTRRPTENMYQPTTKRPQSEYLPGPSESNDSGMPSWGIPVIVVGALLMLCVMVAAAWYLMRSSSLAAAGAGPGFGKSAATYSSVGANELQPVHGMQGQYGNGGYSPAMGSRGAPGQGQWGSVRSPLQSGSPNGFPSHHRGPSFR